LIVEAPIGVATADLKAELIRHKAELLSALDTAPDRPPSADTVTAEALRQVAALFAVAFQRYTAVKRVPRNQDEDSVNKELAISDGPSVHGHGSPI
jgi:hypothetical protein